ncbi:hypothetical protein GGF46_003867 [Coemansia sp. RSA 552]|nr:hypothetical protein GGF46_003867 [Coemansia sp. RSA 552]
MPGYPSAPHYAPYNMGMRGGGRMAQYQVRAMEERAAAPGLSSPSSSSSSASPPAVGGRVAKKRVRNAWPAEMTRQIINVLLTEFLDDPGFRTTIYRSREERDHRFIPSGRSILEEYNKVQNIRRRYFIPLSYLLQWDELRTAGGNLRGRQRANIEKKLAKPLERSRLEMIFNEANRTRTPSQDDGDEQSKPVFELDIFVSELKSRDPILWARGIAAFEAWVSRKCAVNFILNH